MSKSLYYRHKAIFDLAFLRMIAQQRFPVSQVITDDDYKPLPVGCQCHTQNEFDGFFFNYACAVCTAASMPVLEKSSHLAEPNGYPDTVIPDISSILELNP